MLPGARMLFSRRMEKLAYDAEVEYLESVHTSRKLSAFIDTGVNANEMTGFDMVFTPLSYYSPAYQAYLSTESNTDCVIGRMGTTSDLGSLYFRYDGNKTIFVDSEALSFTSPNRVYIDANRRFIVNGVDRGSIPASVLGTVSETMRFGGIKPSVSRNGSVRLYSIKIYGIGNVKIRDLIPVRKDNVGYMYDRVSGRLFGNAGTGEFVLGPDIIDYTAKDYVQDGLVAMWDGIENAGWGVHDSNATVWKDLVSEVDWVKKKY